MALLDPKCNLSLAIDIPFVFILIDLNPDPRPFVLINGLGSSGVDMGLPLPDSKTPKSLLSPGRSFKRLI